LFFIVGEVLNAMVKQATKIVEVVGIKVPKIGQQQILSQYAMTLKLLLLSFLSMYYPLEIF